MGNLLEAGHVADQMQRAVVVDGRLKERPVLCVEHIEQN